MHRRAAISSFILIATLMALTRDTAANNSQLPAIASTYSTLVNVALTYQPNTVQASSSEPMKSWPAFLAKVRMAVRKRDRAVLRELMDPGFQYDCCVNEDENGDGDLREEAFTRWRKFPKEGWAALDRLLAQGVVTASTEWSRNNGRSKPNLIAPRRANSSKYNGPIADFHFRDGRWYFVSFQFPENDVD